jgi:hypothetical protein
MKIFQIFFDISYRNDNTDLVQWATTETCVFSSDHHTYRPVPIAGPMPVLRLCVSYSAPELCTHTWKHKIKLLSKIISLN